MKWTGSPCVEVSDFKAVNRGRGFPDVLIGIIATEDYVTTAEPTNIQHATILNLHELKTLACKLPHLIPHALPNAFRRPGAVPAVHPLRSFRKELVRLLIFDTKGVPRIHACVWNHRARARKNVWGNDVCRERKLCVTHKRYTPVVLS